ncbi:unnamed protein product [Rhizoctonia solani]|nr:unnamed protein product [Rhizoctonia solani]
MHIWDVQTGTSIFGPLRGHTQWLRSVVYSPDDTRVASASDDATIRIWNASTEANSSPAIEWVLNEDGWVTDGKSQRMMWVPLDMRGSLMWPRNTMMMSHDGYVRLDFDGAIIGEAWTDCWLGL